MIELTILIPTKEEKGNIEPAVCRMPNFGVETELLFVDGHSVDGTMAELERVASAYPNRCIHYFTQEGKGKRAAVWQGFKRAMGKVVIILDGDITVPPEELLGAYEILSKSENIFVNATRFRYPMEKRAMQFLNYLANRLFALLVSFIVGTWLSDTLCGTKGMRKDDFIKLCEEGFLNNIDPFGDHELIFGAWNLGMKIVNYPVHYSARSYGSPKIANMKISGGSAFLRIDLAALKHKFLKRSKIRFSQNELR
ncbi:glycosyltransferase family 2 protein [Desulfatiglans anilini]|uniref:glycosyltransferase family 2 protein n=1 Tax=Desulfatiglans anilini TaxID=90728 RepID=UPI000688CF47|nr:glycosyltransferase family 2 protein [Desulfatiglans anilini]